MINKYFIPIRGHTTVFAKSEKEAHEIVSKDLEEYTHQNYNLKTYVIR